MYQIPVNYISPNGDRPVGRVIDNGNQRYSAIFYPPVKIIKPHQASHHQHHQHQHHHSHHAKTKEQEERARREKIRKCLYNCAVELSISSPLCRKLRERLSMVLPRPPLWTDIYQGYEKYCSTNLSRSHYTDSHSSYGYASHHHYSNFKPSRTLRSNTAITNDKSSSSNTCHVHIYTFNRKQRYRRWAQIENSLGSSRRLTKKLKTRYLNRNKSDFEDIIFCETHPNSSSPSPPPSPKQVKSTPIFPIIDLDEIPADRESSNKPNTTNNKLEGQKHKQQILPPYIIKFYAESNKSTLKKSIKSSSLSYEVILEPPNISTNQDDLSDINVQSKTDSFTEKKPIITKSVPISKPTITSTTTSTTTKVSTTSDTSATTATITSPVIIKAIASNTLQAPVSTTAIKPVVPVRRSLRREKININSMNNPANNLSLNNCSGVDKSESTKNEINKSSPSSCDVTLTIGTKSNKLTYSEQELLQTKDVVIKPLPSSPPTESIKSSKSITKTKDSCQTDKLISMEMFMDSNTFAYHIDYQPISKTKPTNDDKVMIIQTEDDLPRIKKLATDDIIMVKVIDSAKH